VIIVLIYYYGKKAGKKDVPDVDYPSGGKAIPLGWSPLDMIAKLENILNYITPPDKYAERNQLFRDFAALPTADMFVAVNNGFNQRNSGDGKGSLRQRMAKEYYVWPLADTRYLVRNRMTKLKIS